MKIYTDKEQLALMERWLKATREARDSFHFEFMHMHFKSAKTKKIIKCWQIIGVDEIPSSPLKSRPKKFTIVSRDTKAEALESFQNVWCKGKSVAQMEVELAVIVEGT